MAIATKPKKQTIHHKKCAGLHQRRSQHFMKTYWPYIPMIAIVGLGLLVNTQLTNHGKHGVLAYATDISVAELFSDTNAQRTANSVATLTLNDELDAAAQAKANDMVTQGYWSHVTPQGEQPWGFIVAAGYSYQAAAENLAYGFDNSADTIQGWMNSPDHRANMLNNVYQDVGFGIANSPNFQNSGPETIVVAEYAEPTAPQPVTAATAPVTTTPVTTKSEPAATIPTPSAATTTTSSPTPTPQPTKTTAPTPTPTTDATTTAHTNVTDLPEPPSIRVARVQLLASTSAPWVLYAVSSIASVGVALFFIRHARQWRRYLLKEQAFVQHHLLLDMLIVSMVMAGLILVGNAGVIR